MKLLLASGGVTNGSIRSALEQMLGKPIAECTALCIPTAMYGHPDVGPGVRAWQFASGNSTNPMVDVGWKSVGLLELTALPSIDSDRWIPLVREADALLAAGGDVLYLCYWMRQCGPRASPARHTPSMTRRRSRLSTAWLTLCPKGIGASCAHEKRIHQARTTAILATRCA